uniref:Ubiquitin-protein ligase n=1 Tax=Solanum tuberosum TaxID=4113 RepID=M0ZT11_SOLTU
MLDSQLGLLHEDDKNVLIAIAQGIISMLVHLLDFSFLLEIRKKTVTAITKISTVTSSKLFLVAGDLCILKNFLRILESPSVLGKENSCIALQALDQEEEFHHL